MINQKQLDKALLELNHVVNEYKQKYSVKSERDWRTYEQRLARRMKKAAEEIEPIIEEAYSAIDTTRPDERGRPPKITVTKKVLILLLKDIFHLSNRKMSNLLMFFTLLTGIDISYKSIERSYSDELVKMTIHNMFAIMTKAKGIGGADVSGDGTGYGLTVTKHYRNEREKELSGKKCDRKAFVCAFALMDLDTKMYVGYGTSMRSEKEAFKAALGMANAAGVSIRSARLDKYYSYQSITKEFGNDTKLYVIPKRNATIKGSPAWKRIIKSFVTDVFHHLKEYYKRNNSESGFNVDKGLCGRKIFQRREDRIGTALMCKGIWHNLMLIG